MSQDTSFSTRVYHVRRACGRERFVATDHPYQIELGPEDATLSCKMVDTSTMTPRERALLRAAIEFDALKVGNEYMSWIVARDVRAACVVEMAKTELELLDYAIVDASELFGEDDSDAEHTRIDAIPYAMAVSP